MELSSSTVAPSSSVALSVKLEAKGEFRRFSLETVTFAALREAVAAIFGSDPFVIRYKDEDGDDISCTNEQEFATALSLLSADRVFRCAAVSSAKQEKKAAKQEKKQDKKRTKRDAKSEKKSRKAAKKERKASKVESSSSSSEESSASVDGPAAESSESLSSSEDSKKKSSRKAAKNQQKAARKARQAEEKAHKKSHKHDELSESSDDDAEASASSSSESVRKDEVEAKIAQLQAKISELLNRAGPEAVARYDRRVEKKKAKKQAKHEKKAAKKQRKAEEDSSTSSESSISEDETARQEMKERLRELKRNRKLLMKAARHTLKRAQSDAKEAKKKLDREVSLFKEESRGSKREFDARFVNHVNFPDNADVEPSFGLNKSFKFMNTGSKAWPATVKLLLVSRFDNSLNAPDSVEVGHEVNPGEEVVITVPLRTPAHAGVYDAFFRLALTSGQKFGQRIRCRLHVLASALATPAPVSTSHETPELPETHETPAAPAAPHDLVEEEPAPTTISAPILLAAAAEVKDDHSVLA